MVNILTTPAGTPVLINSEGEAITLTDEHQGFLLGEAMDDPTLLDALERRIRLAVEEIAGLDPDLPTSDWHMHFQMLLTINQFTTPLRIIGQARYSLEGMSRE